MVAGCRVVAQYWKRVETLLQGSLKVHIQSPTEMPDLARNIAKHTNMTLGVINGLGTDEMDFLCGDCSPSATPDLLAGPEPLTDLSLLSPGTLCATGYCPWSRDVRTCNALAPRFCKA